MINIFLDLILENSYLLSLFLNSNHTMFLNFSFSSFILCFFCWRFFGVRLVIHVRFLILVFKSAFPDILTLYVHLPYIFYCKAFLPIILILVGTTLFKLFGVKLKNQDRNLNTENLTWEKFCPFWFNFRFEK